MAPVIDKRRALVVIEDSTIIALASNPKALAEFPFLGAVKQGMQGKRSPCGRPCGKTAKIVHNALAGAKASIAGLADDKKRRLKEYLGAKQARVFFRSGKNAMVKFTF